jgi:hypothetical protein
MQFLECYQLYPIRKRNYINIIINIFIHYYVKFSSLLPVQNNNEKLS